MKGQEWTKAEDAFLRAKIAERWSSGEVGRALKKSRNSCIGRARRLGLSFNSSSGAALANKVAAALRRGANKKPKPKPPTPPPKSPPPSIDAAEPVPIGPVRDIPSGPVCRAIHGHPGVDPDWQYCGHPTASFLTPYCAHHVKKFFTPAGRSSIAATRPMRRR